MALTSPGKGAALRARRWDVVVLGGALPGLVLAARLARGGLRTLLVEEETASRMHPGWREPFLLTGGTSGGVLDGCLREIGLGPADRRSWTRDPVAFQWIGPDARIDLGDLTRSVEELDSWGVCKRDVASDTLRLFVQAAAAERDAMLDAPVVRTGRLRALSGRGPRRERGLPADAAAPPAELRPLLHAQVRALSHLAAAKPPPEARARLLGAPYEGSVVTGAPGSTLRALLRERARRHHCETLTVSRGFELVEMGGSPGIAVQRTGEVWVGRALVLNAPRPALAQAMATWKTEVPELLQGPPASHRRVTVHLRARTRVVPDPMARRLICVGGGPQRGDPVVTLQRFPDESGRTQDLIGVCVAPDDPDAIAAAESAVEARAGELMPFSDGALGRVQLTPPTWDDDAWLRDPPTGHGWPSDAEIRLSSRPPIFALERESVGALGAEGELLLGWRAADAVRVALG